MLIRVKCFLNSAVGKFHFKSCCSESVLVVNVPRSQQLFPAQTLTSFLALFLRIQAFCRVALPFLSRGIEGIEYASGMFLPLKLLSQLGRKLQSKVRRSSSGPPAVKIVRNCNSDTRKIGSTWRELVQMVSSSTIPPHSHNKRSESSSSSGQFKLK